MKIYSDGKNRNLTGEFPKRFKLKQGEKDIPYIRTGANRIRISGDIPFGDLDIEEIIQEKTPVPAKIKSLTFSMIDQADIDRLDVLNQKLALSQAKMSEQLLYMQEHEGVIAELETKNAQEIQETKEKIQELAASVANEIQTDRENVQTITRDIVFSLQQTGSNLVSKIEDHERADNPHGINKDSIGLGLVDNTPDLKKPVSLKVQEKLDLKADKSELKELETKILEETDKSNKNLLNSINYYGGATGRELPIGGKKDQVLTKASNKDGDYKWSDSSGGSSVTVHNNLSGRSDFNAHPISAITNLQSELNAKQGSLTEEQLTAVNSGVTAVDVEAISTNTSNISTIASKIPSAATSSNKLADKAFVNSSINNVAAYYITSNADGDAFGSKSALDTGPWYFNGASRTPTTNDYALVEEDETHDDKTTRYTYTGSQWAYQYTLNHTHFTQAQLDALNSGIDSNLVSDYSTHVADTDIHVTTAEKTTWNGKQNAISDLNTIRSGASAGSTAVQPADLASYVPTSRKINGKNLTTDITLTSTDVGVNDGTLTINNYGTALGTFSANQSSNNMIDIEVPEIIAGTDISIDDTIQTTETGTKEVLLENSSQNGLINIKVFGKAETLNFINKNTMTPNCYINTSGTIVTKNQNLDITDYIEVEVGKTYHYTAIIYGTSPCLAYYDENQDLLGTIVMNNVRDYTPTTGTKYVRLSVYKTSLEIATFTEEMSPTNPVPIMCNNGAVGRSGGGTIETISMNGQTATAQDLLSCEDAVDEQNITTGEITRNVGYRIIKGDEADWATYSGSSSTGYMYRLPNEEQTTETFTGISTHFKFQRSNYAIANMVIGDCKGMSTGQLYFCSSESTLEDFKTWLATQYTNGNPVVIVYPLATPTTETVTPQTNIQTVAGNNTLSIVQASVDYLSLSATYNKNGVAIINFNNSTGYITGINSSDVTAALGYTPVNPTSLATVATTGAYSDLSGTPTIPTVNNPTITITQGGVTKGSFTLNQSSGDTIALDAGGGSSLPSQTGNAGKFLTTDGTDASWGKVKTHNLFDFKPSDHLLNDQNWLRADTFSWQDGTVYSDAYDHLENDIDGITASTETIGGYTVTYYLATDGHKIVLPDQETTISNIFTATGIAWYYVLDTVNKRFKLPRTKYGFVGLRDIVGKYVPESLPNIKGYPDYNDDNTTNYRIRSLNPTGAFVKSTQTNVCPFSSQGTSATSLDVASFDASASCSTYQDNAPVQQRATQMYLYFYVGQFSQSATEQTAGITTETLNGKADTDLGNIDSAGENVIKTIFDTKLVLVNSLPATPDNDVWYAIPE